MLSILNLIFFFVIFFGDIFYVVNKYKTSIANAQLSIILGQIVVLFIFSVFNILQIGFYIVICITVFFAIKGLIDKNQWREILQEFRTPECVVIVLIFFLSFYFSRGAMFHVWDEFSHWGCIYKTMMITNNLPDTNSCVFVLNYPPGTALYQYFIGKIIGFGNSFSHLEYNAYFAHALLIFSSLLSVFPKVIKRNYFIYFVGVTVGFLSIFLLDFSIQSLYSDLIQGILFAAGLAKLIDKDNLTNRSNTIQILLISMVLPLVKPLGFIFSVILISCFLFTVLVKIAHIGNSHLKGKFNKTMKLVLKKEMLLLLVLPVLMNLVWGLHTQKYATSSLKFTVTEPALSVEKITPMGVEKLLAELSQEERKIRFEQTLLLEPRKIEISLVGIIKAFTAYAPYSTKVTIKNFINIISETPYTNSQLTPLQFILLIFGIAIFLINFQNFNDVEKRNQIIAINLVLLFGFILYAFTLLFSYIYYFFPIEGMNVPSLTRYLGSYLLAWLVMDVATLYYSAESSTTRMNKPNLEKWILTGFLVVALLSIPMNSYLRNPALGIEHRFQVAREYNKADLGSLSQNSKVYIIWQGYNMNGFQLHILRYLLCPLPSNFYGWRLGKPEDQNDKMSLNISPGKLMEILHSKGYTHVFIAVADDPFWAKYGVLFNKHERYKSLLYKVTPNSLEFIR